ncbi:hypothetical protein BGZ63DRAFT_386298 [Mariannaea sp. PMI_226]|nr:hypothetical protein BGZ63DRAFT_386298 [Mariannaea sp. PMI_226]
MESSSSSSEAEDPQPCPWLTEEDLNLIGHLGLPDPYHWGNLQTWVERVLQAYHAQISDSRVVRQRFIRTKCVRCKRLCEDADLESIIDPPVALPCGHIMGWTCYAEFVDNYTAGEGSGECPWKGPTGEEPPEWSPACGERIIYVCEHPAMFARIPAPSREFYLPQQFFIPPDGFMPSNCRRCTVHNLLAQWTREVRRNGAGSDVFVCCSGADELRDGGGANYRGLVRPEYARAAMDNSAILEEIFARTPAPAENGELEEMSSNVIYVSLPEDSRRDI